MTINSDLRLANDLQEEINYFKQPGAHVDTIKDEQEWIAEAEVLVRRLRDVPLAEDRIRARSLLKRTPPTKP